MDLTPGSKLRHYQLEDAIWATKGQVLLSGTQALVRLMVMQRQLDHQSGVQTAGFISGYRGSPLGMVDQVIWNQGEKLSKAGVEFSPAINEELAATQILGTQRVETDPKKNKEAVFSLWYGKGPGVDRAGDALKHGNAYGSSPTGGVLVVAGDDHGCVSSSMSHQSDLAFQAWQMPVVSPADVFELVHFGMYGLALSRYCGAWVGMTALSEIVESTSTVDIDELNTLIRTWKSAHEVMKTTGHQTPQGGLHYRWPDLPSMQIESRLKAKLEAVAKFSTVNSIDRLVVNSEKAQVGILTAGKAHHDLMEVFRRMQLSESDLMQAGIRILKIGLTFPLNKSLIEDFSIGLKEILVIEEKAPVVERQLMAILFNKPLQNRPVVVGKNDIFGQPLISEIEELRPSRLIGVVSQWLKKHDLMKLSSADLEVADFIPFKILSNNSDKIKRIPYFCAGCPHSTSTKLPKGSTARAGIGCHFMANWMERSTEGLIQMGGEGVDWVSQSKFTKTKHIFQNIGDGTYFHYGHLAIRQAVAANANITYKLLYNNAVAMTGGQAVDGALSVEAIAWQMESEGAKAISIVSDEIKKYKKIEKNFPKKCSFYPREKLEEVQRQLREIKGVSILIYEQECAAEKRRKIKTKKIVDEKKHIFINKAVCEGCGDCSIQSNCLAVVPIETEWGRKRKIDQTTCNKDFTCTNGFCPAFVTIQGANIRTKSGSTAEIRAKLIAESKLLPEISTPLLEHPWDILLAGVGGTGIVTVGAIIAMAANLENKQVSVLDFMGFAQKGGAVLSYVRMTSLPHTLNQVRIDAQQADALIACDAVVAASPDALQTIRLDRTKIVVNTHETPVADSVRYSDFELNTNELIDKLNHAAGHGQVKTFDAHLLAEQFVGHTRCVNILILGMSWQLGLVPISSAAVKQAIKINNVDIEDNLYAFAIGRLAAIKPEILDIREENIGEESSDKFIERAVHHLTAWQDNKWAESFKNFLFQINQDLDLNSAEKEKTLSIIAKSLHKLMSYKDEYEVSRLLTSNEFETDLAQMFGKNYKLHYSLYPYASFHSNASSHRPQKISLNAWFRPFLRLLAKGKFLRGHVWDPFGHGQERIQERNEIQRYKNTVKELVPLITIKNVHLINEILSLPLSMRGFGHVKLRNVMKAREKEQQLLKQLY